MSVIGFLGAFAIDNPGDVLLGYATRQAVARRLPDADLRLYAPRLPHASWRQEFSVARGIDRQVHEAGGSWAHDLDALIIGGGGLLGAAPTFAPFRRAALELDRPAAWNSMCSQNEPWYGAEQTAFLGEVRQACERLAYVSVRNVTTRHLVEKSGFVGRVELVPDPVLALEVPRTDVADELLAAAGVVPGRFVVGLSVGNAFEDPRAAGFFAELLTVLGDSDAEIVLLPFGPIYGDDRLADLVQTRLPRARRLPRALAPLELWQLVGRLDFYVCTRLHAVLAAVAQDTPFVVLDEYLGDATASSKIRDFVVEAELEGSYLCPFLPSRPAAKLAARLREARAGAPSLGPLVARLRARFDRHIDDMLVALGLTGRAS